MQNISELKLLSVPIRLDDNFYIIIKELKDVGCIIIKDGQQLYLNDFVRSVFKDEVISDIRCTFTNTSIGEYMQTREEFGHTARIDKDIFNAQYVKRRSPDYPDYDIWLIFPDTTDYAKHSSYIKSSKITQVLVSILQSVNMQLETHFRAMEINKLISKAVQQILDIYHLRFAAFYKKIHDEFVYASSYGDIEETEAIKLSSLLQEKKVKRLLDEFTESIIINLHYVDVPKKVLENIDIFYPVYMDGKLSNIMLFKFDVFKLFTSETYNQITLVAEVLFKLINRTMYSDKQSDFYSTLLDLSEDSITLHSKGILTYANKATMQMFEFPDIQSMIGINVLDYVHEDSKTLVKERMNTLLNGGNVEPWVYEKFVTYKGNILEGRASAKLITLDNEPFILVVLHDISTETKLKKEILFSEQKYQALVDSSPDPILILQRGKITFGNAKVEELFETNQDNFLGKSFVDYIDDDDEIQRYFADEIIVDKYNRLIPVRFKVNDKTIKHLELSLANIFYEESPADLVVIRDRSFIVWARTQVEEKEIRYRELFKTSSDAIYVSTESGEFLDFNPKLLDLFGYTDEEIRNINLVELYQNPQDRSDLLEFVERDGFVVNYELHLKNKQGKKLICLLTTQGYHNEITGQVTYQGILRDVTEERRKEQATLITQKLESLGILAGGIAHDFNNLLMGILTSSSLAMSYVDDNSEVKKLLSMINATSKRAAALVDQLLAYAGEARISKENIKLSELIKKIRSIIEFAVSSEVKLDFEFNDEISLIELDVVQIEQVIMNLVRNSIDAIQNIGRLAKIVVRTEFIEITENNDFIDLGSMKPLSPGPYTVLEIEDNGIGINEQEITQIFDPFFSTKFTGRGLGLAAVLGIIKGHNAGIVVQSTYDVGTKFSVFFPVDVDLIDIHLLKNKDQEIQPLQSVTESINTILLVDDEPMILKIVSKLISTLGFKPITAKSGEEAIEILKNDDSVGLVILDLTMPGMDGRECLRTIRDLGYEVPIVISSGYSESESLMGVQDYNVNGFLHKPYVIEDLQQVITRIMY